MNYINRVIFNFAKRNFETTYGIYNAYFLAFHTIKAINNQKIIKVN